MYDIQILPEAYLGTWQRFVMKPFCEKVKKAPSQIFDRFLIHIITPEIKQINKQKNQIN